MCRSFKFLNLTHLYTKSNALLFISYHMYDERYMNKKKMRTCSLSWITDFDTFYAAPAWAWLLIRNPNNITEPTVKTTKQAKSMTTWKWRGQYWYYSTNPELAIVVKGALWSVLNLKGLEIRMSWRFLYRYIFVHGSHLTMYPYDYRS